MKIYFFVILFFLLAFSFPALGYSSISNIFFESIDPKNLMVGQEITGEMIIEISCSDTSGLGGSSGGEAIPKIDYGDGIKESIGEACECEGDTGEIKRVRCSYRFSHTFDATGTYSVIPQTTLEESSAGFVPGSGIFHSGSPIGIKIFPEPTIKHATSESPLKATTTAALIKKATSIIYVIGYSLTALFIMIGGFIILTSSGDPKQATKGKDIILYTIIAFAILVLSRGIINFIFMIFDIPTI